MEMENQHSLKSVASQATSTDYNTGSNDIIGSLIDNPTTGICCKTRCSTSGNGSWRTSTMGSDCNEYEQLYSRTC